MKRELTSFTGGIRNRPNPAFLKESEAVIARNINVDTGNLSNSLGAELASSTISNPVYISSDVTVSSSGSNMVKTLHSRVYNTDINTESPTSVLFDGESHELPLVPPIGLTVAHTLLNTRSSIRGGRQGNLLLAITKYNRTTGYESAPEFITIEAETPIRLEVDFSIGTHTNPLMVGTQSDMNVAYTSAAQGSDVAIPGYIANGTLVDEGPDLDASLGVNIGGTAADAINDMLAEHFTTPPNYAQRDLYTNLVIGMVGRRSAIQGIIYAVNNIGYSQEDILSVHQYMKDFGLTNGHVVYRKITYVPGIASITIENIVVDPSLDLRVYRLGKFGHEPSNTEYELIDSLTGGDIPYLIFAANDVLNDGTVEVQVGGYIVSPINETYAEFGFTVDGRLPITLDQIHSLNTSMFAVSTSNIWLAEYDSNKVWYTETGSLDIIRTVAYVSLPAKITGIHYVNNSLVIFCEDSSIHNITGTTRANITLNRISDDIDCVDVRTITRVTQTLVWLSSKGLVVSNGYSVQLLHREDIVLDAYQPNTDTISSTSVNDEYYLLVDDTILLYNLSYKRLLTFGSQGAKKLFLYKGDVYMHNGATSVGKLFSGQPVPMEYVTGTIVRPGYDVRKEFLFVRIAYKGDIEVVITVDELVVNTVALPSSTKPTHTAFQLQAGVSGYLAQIKVLGIGTVYSIAFEYEVLETL